MFELEVIPKSDEYLRSDMRRHYSKPKGFVGRSICYAVCYDGIYYGHIAAGSATLHLPRDFECPLENIVNNIFFHIEKQDGKYPIRNFATATILEFVEQIQVDWKAKYGDEVFYIETLVELPRTGECYRRAGFEEIGTTKGYTCKRVGGQGTDSWSGKRVWDTKNLRPKRVFVYEL